MKKNNKGFTLIELIVTIALLAVIAIISFVSINGVINQSKVNNCENLRKNIITAAKEYVSDNRYKNDFNVVIAGVKKIVTIDVKTLTDDFYLSEEIVNPFKSSVIVAGDKLKIKITLNADYSANSVSIYKKDASDPDNMYTCSEDWWSDIS